MSSQTSTIILLPISASISLSQPAPSSTIVFIIDSSADSYHNLSIHILVYMSKM